MPVVFTLCACGGANPISAVTTTMEQLFRRLTDNGKRVERRGRKAMDLKSREGNGTPVRTMTARLPKKAPSLT